MSGLLGDSTDDPKSMATWNLVAGLLSPGSFGQGLGKGLAGYQDSLATNQAMQLRQQQIAQAIQDQKIKDIQLQQQTRMFNLQTPFLEEAVNRMRGGDAGSPPVPGAPTPSPTPGAPPGLGQPMQGMPMPPQAAPQQVAPQQAAPTPQRGTMFPGVPDNVAYATIGTGGFAKLPELISKFNEPTEFVKTLTAAGIDPASAIGRQLIQANIAKSNYVAPLNVRPGGTVYNAQLGQPEFAAPDSRGTQITYGPNGPSMGMVPGAVEAETAAARATEAGKGSVLPYAAVSSTGAPLPITNRTAAATGGASASSVAPVIAPNGHPTVTSDAALQGIREALPLMVAERDKLPPGPDKDAATREINRNQNALLSGKPWATSSASAAAPSGAMYAAAPMGAETTAKESAKDVVENYNGMHTFATTSAPRNIGLLQTIQQLADKTMIGPGANKVQFVNGVLNTIGVTPGADQAQNYQIMKKNLNMLVGSQRMGAAGGGSDALQALLEASNPNVAEMNGPAAKEAAEELIAYNRMMMAKDKILPSPLSVPTQQYQQAETQFSKFADPRLWQVEHAHSDAERARILSLIPASERASFLSKAKEARSLGVLN